MDENSCKVPFRKVSSVGWLDAKQRAAYPRPIWIWLVCWFPSRKWLDKPCLESILLWKLDYILQLYLCSIHTKKSSGRKFLCPIHDVRVEEQDIRMLKLSKKLAPWEVLGSNVFHDSGRVKRSWRRQSMNIASLLDRFNQIKALKCKSKNEGNKLLKQLSSSHQSISEPT